MSGSVQVTYYRGDGEAIGMQLIPDGMGFVLPAGMAGLVTAIAVTIVPDSDSAETEPVTASPAAEP
jgi:hypothetical protein